MKDPAFLFYSGDFIAGVSEMTMEERGQYITLLCFQHNKGHLSLEFINRVTPGLSEYVFSKFVKDNEGLFYNERLDYETQKRKKYSESRSNNRKGKPKDIINICESYDNHMENENENRDVNDIVIGNENNKGVDLKKISKERVETWNGLKIGSKVKDRDHRIMPWEEYVKIQQSHNRRSCAPINAPLVWLSSEEYNKLKAKYKSEDMVRAMIVVMNNWKAKTRFAEQRNINDYLAIDDSWVAEKAVKELSILNGQTIEKLRKQEVMKEEFKKNNAISFYTPEPYKNDEAQQ
jgi:hypothetical protein